MRRYGSQCRLCKARSHDRRSGHTGDCSRHAGFGAAVAPGNRTAVAAASPGALLPGGVGRLAPVAEPLRQSCWPVLETFVGEQAVIAELARLVRGRAPDLEMLDDSFAECTAGYGLPPFPIPWAAGIEAFLHAADQEPALAACIPMAQLRDAAQRLRAGGTNDEGSDQTAALARASTGEITANGDITADNLITGTQINHIIHVYQAGGGTWGEIEYRTALDRYLAAGCGHGAGGAARHQAWWPASG